MLTSESLAIFPDKEIKEISEFISNATINNFKKRGVIIALSGGIDSTVTAALCANALGPSRVLGLLLPEQHSSEDTTRLGKVAAEALGIKHILFDITSSLESSGCYKSQTEAIKSVVPLYETGNPFKIVLPPLSAHDSFRIYSIVVQLSNGEIIKKRLTLDAYLQLVAATNFKQRTRKMIEYYFADRYNYAVAGSPNRLEYDQGFFVKSGDGAADIKPIAHLYKTQVYQIAKHLNLPKEIINRPPTTDTYPMEQSQEEFYFSLPYHQMDLCLFAKNNNYPPEQVATLTGLPIDNIAMIYNDIDRKRKTTFYQHSQPLLFKKVPEISVLHRSVV